MQTMHQKILTLILELSCILIMYRKIQKLKLPFRNLRGSFFVLQIIDEILPQPSTAGL